MLKYHYNDQAIQIHEEAGPDETEFHIRLLQLEPLEKQLQEVARWFESNRVYTDVLFYSYEDHRYKVVVRQDYYEDFILSLMKHRLVEQVEWS